MKQIASEQKLGEEWWLRLDLVWQPDAQIVIQMVRERPGDADVVHDADGIRCAMPRELTTYLKGVQIEWIEEKPKGRFNVSFDHQSSAEREAGRRWLREQEERIKAVGKDSKPMCCPRRWREACQPPPLVVASFDSARGKRRKSLSGSGFRSDGHIAAVECHVDHLAPFDTWLVPASRVLQVVIGRAFCFTDRHTPRQSNSGRQRNDGRLRVRGVRETFGNGTGHLSEQKEDAARPSFHSLGPPFPS